MVRRPLPIPEAYLFPFGAEEPCISRVGSFLSLLQRDRSASFEMSPFQKNKQGLLEGMGICLLKEEKGRTVSQDACRRQDRPA